MDEKELIKKWILTKDCLPSIDDDYLVCVNYGNHRKIEILSFTNNLSAIDEYDFPNETRPGWYAYDGECGYYEVDNVEAWFSVRIPLPIF